MTTRFVAVNVALAAIHSFRLLGDWSDIALSVLTIAAISAIVIGVRRNRPRPAGPWLLVAGSGVLFAIGAIFRESEGSTGNLTAHRPVLPDVFTFPGYFAFAVALIWLLQIRQRREYGVGVALDAFILAIGSFVLVWALLLDPTLSRRDVALVALVAVSIYPPVSVFLVSVAARLAFSPGQRSASHRMLLGGMVSLLVGDVIYFLVDTHVLNPPGRLVDLPYGITYALIGGAALHPSMREVARPRPAGDPTALRRSRSLLVGAALFVPVLLLLGWSPSHLVERIVMTILVATLCSAAIARIVVAIREQSRSEARLAHLALHDPLTGLPNRVHALEFIASLLEADHGAGSVGVVFLDLDRFKLVNDSLGHPTGDRLLSAVATRLTNLTRPGDLVSRTSGDEFVIVAGGVDVAATVALGERIRAGFETPLDIGSEMVVTVSIGVAHSASTFGVDAAADLIRNADTAMYRSKDRGGNAVTTFDDPMRERVARRLALESALRRALAAGELEVHYQPIVQIETGRIEGFEALARWRTDEGWIPPVEFIPVAEESGLIIPLGAWIMGEAARQVAVWRALPGGTHLTMSVNVSARQVGSSDVVAMVRDALDRCELPGEALWFELTESTMMLDTEDTADTLRRLRALGVRSCVDDFGTGFSSLAYLQRFAIDRLKIDRSFVTAMGDDAAGLSFVSTILAISRVLGVDVVAEGVETTEQATQLLSVGCVSAQGYLFGRPASAADIEVELGRIAADAVHGRTEASSAVGGD
ncbi:MAG TPA: EAL domain-containing protein [Acidimicrobiales bacterium]|nr:EAL domain-containing protein [Acidimicrobiales bacterium]